MATPKINSAFTFRVPFYLGNTLVASPTLAAGDAVVFTAGASTGNLNTLTSTTYGADCIASATQMNGADVLIQFTDQTTPRAWDPFTVVLSLDAKTADDLGTDIAGVQSDTDNIQTRIPTALVGGKMDSNVGTMGSGVLTTAAIATGAFDPTVFSSSAEAAFADAFLARHQKGGSAGGSGTKVSDAIAGGLMKISISAGVMTVLNGDGSTAFTRTLTRAALDAIITAT